MADSCLCKYLLPGEQSFKILTFWCSYDLMIVLKSCYVELKWTPCMRFRLFWLFEADRQFCPWSSLEINHWWPLLLLLRESLEFSRNDFHWIQWIMTKSKSNTPCLTIEYISRSSCEINFSPLPWRWGRCRWISTWMWCWNMLSIAVSRYISTAR